MKWHLCAKNVEKKCLILNAKPFATTAETKWIAATYFSILPYIHPSLYSCCFKLKIFIYGMRAQYIAVVVIALFFISAFYVYPLLPNVIAVHWNALGEADGFASKETGLAILPIITFIITLFLFLIPELNSMKKIMQTFQREYELFALTFMLFLGYVFMLTVLWNLGYRFEMVAALIPGMGVLFLVLSYLLEKTTPNPFIGIRTPWTMKNPKTWKHVHVRAAKKLRMAVPIMAVGMVFQDFAILLILLPLVYFVGDSILYSYRMRAAAS